MRKFGLCTVFANIPPLESTYATNREPAILLQPSFTPTAIRCVLTTFALLWGFGAAAGPSIAPGDIALRHDIQRLADAGVIKGPVSTWPLAWAPIAADVRDVDKEAELPADVLQSLLRVRARAERAMRIDEFQLHGAASVAERPMKMRAFEHTPRESAEIGGGVSWTGNWLSRGLSCGWQPACGCTRQFFDFRKHARSLVGSGLGRQPDPR
jgi:hypothetical protein